MIKIIDNKKVEMTQEEFDYYQNICRAYDRPNFTGEELFKGLFLSDDRGIITFICPPSDRYTSMESYLFICSLFQHQHCRLLEDEVHNLVLKYEKRLKELEEKLQSKTHKK